MGCIIQGRLYLWLHRVTKPRGLTVFVADLVHDISVSIRCAYRHVYRPRKLKTLNENQRQKCHLCALTRGTFMGCLLPWSRYQTSAFASRNGISTSGENFPFNIVSKYLKGVSRRTRVFTFSDTHPPAVMYDLRWAGKDFSSLIARGGRH